MILWKHFAAEAEETLLQQYLQLDVGEIKNNPYEG